MIRNMARKRPAVDLSLLECDSRESPRAIRAGEIDLAVVSVDASKDVEWDELTHHHLLENDWCLLLPADHRLARVKQVRVAD